MTDLKSSSKGSKRSTKKGKKEGTLQSPYKKAMRIKGRTFVETKDGDIREMDENGKFIPDHLVKPL